jgi:sec-independent protein translocase protein TatC
MAVQPPVQARPGSPPPPPKPNKDEDARLLTIIEHLQELRYRLMVSAGALVVGIGASFYPLSRLFISFLEQPAKDRVPNFELVFTEPLEFWTAYFQVSLLLGIAIAMPVIVYQVLAFVGPGLTASERRWLFPIVIGASVSFLAGCTFAYYVELPPALKFLIGSTGGVDAHPLIRIQSYISFTTRLILVTGLVFELPLFVMGLAKIGVVRSGQLLRWWRQAIVIAFVVAAIVTPSIDPVTQSLVAGPIIGLYFVGIVLAKLVEGAPLIPR